jgi:hypothetical protein
MGRGYFAASSGNVTDEIIMKYIAKQDYVGTKTVSISQLLSRREIPLEYVLGTAISLLYRLRHTTGHGTHANPWRCVMGKWWPK